MPLFREAGIVEDPWQRLADDAPVPADGLVLVSFARWREARAALLARRGPVGVTLSNTDPVESLASDTSRLDLIVLHFPKFSDGRAYSQARLLRERLGYQGELRAIGGVLQDLGVGATFVAWLRGEDSSSPPVFSFFWKSTQRPPIE